MQCYESLFYTMGWREGIQKRNLFYWFDFEQMVFVEEREMINIHQFSPFRSPS